MNRNDKEPSFFPKILTFCILGCVLLPFIEVLIGIIIVIAVCILIYCIVSFIRKNNIKRSESKSIISQKNDEEDQRKQDYQFYSQFSHKNVIENIPQNRDSISFEFENTIESFDKIFFKVLSYSETFNTIESQNAFLFSFFEKILASKELSFEIIEHAKYAKEYAEYIQETKSSLGFLNASQTGFDAKTYTLFIDLAKSNDFSDSMDGHQFEEYCANLLKLNGFSSVEVTKASGDQGIDIIAYKNSIKYGIQCKLYSKPVGNTAVQEVYAGKDFYNCHIGIVLTNSTFTSSAKQLADKLGIILWDKQFFRELRSSETEGYFNG